MPIIGHLRYAAPPETVVRGGLWSVVGEISQEGKYVILRPQLHWKAVWE